MSPHTVYLGVIDRTLSRASCWRANFSVFFAAAWIRVLTERPGLALAPRTCLPHIIGDHLAPKAHLRSLYIPYNPTFRLTLCSHPRRRSNPAFARVTRPRGHGAAVPKLPLRSASAR